MIAYTPGEPAGIGLDLALILASRADGFPCLTLADPDLLKARARRLGLAIDIDEWSPGEAIIPRQGHLSCQPVKAAFEAVPGSPDSRNARYVLKTLERATEGCLDGEFSALVTGPVQKSVINEAGIPFSGHTEWLAQACGDVQPVMMLTTPGLRVALATTHLPLREVPGRINEDLLHRVLDVLHADLEQRFGIDSPRIAICGLNPHAGESGHLGHEDDNIIAPALMRARERGLRLDGPLPADTAFTPDKMACTDAFLAMYHDQGLPVLKHVGFGRSVNVTLGLPIIRTSVDHGTALDRAGRGGINTGSLEYAIEVAREQQKNARDTPCGAKP